VHNADIILHSPYMIHSRLLNQHTILPGSSYLMQTDQKTIAILKSGLHEFSKTNFSHCVYLNSKRVTQHGYHNGNLLTKGLDYRFVDSDWQHSNWGLDLLALPLFLSLHSLNTMWPGFLLCSYLLVFPRFCSEADSSFSCIHPI